MPEASATAVEVSNTLGAVTLMLPPRSPAFSPRARRLPPVLAMPALLSSAMTPLRSTSVSARMMPSLLSTVSSRALALFALRITRPPSAVMAPLLRMAAVSAA